MQSPRKTRMQAISKLRRSGMSTQEIADGANTDTHVIYSYESFRRFPGQKIFLCLVEMAETRGVTLLARDFLPPADAVHCEPNGAVLRK